MGHCTFERITCVIWVVLFCDLTLGEFSFLELRVTKYTGMLLGATVNASCKLYPVLNASITDLNSYQNRPLVHIFLYCVLRSTRKCKG